MFNKHANLFFILFVGFFVKTPKFTVTMAATYNYIFNLFFDFFDNERKMQQDKVKEKKKS